MAIFKCKICGGTLEIDRTQSVATCEYCGTKQTLPKLDDDRKANLYDRANHFRRNNDFDKAMSIYEQILNEDNTDAESYWSILLCRYGIEYVEDPSTHKRVPTVNRAQFTSIFDDEDYKSALQYADSYQREIYEEEASAINEIQKGILSISQKEEPFDVFVCYKETDNNGRRTQDSVLATELYHELTREGFKVFFSRITLEDKLGNAYEPYIFAAIHSAKVMVVLGTRPEYFNAVWVKNEWSRYLALIKNGAKKTLIPAYRDMDTYDLPEEFSHLQAQDMSKLGFMQDLTRGIKKIVEADAPKITVKETIVAAAAALNIAPLLKRAFMFLEDGDFDRADEFCEQVLNQDPENAQAYLGKLMVDLRVKRQSDLANCAEPFDNNKNYHKIIRFADAKLCADLKGYILTIKDRNERKAEEERKNTLFMKAMDACKSYEVAQLEEAIKIFESLSGYKDSDEFIRICKKKIDQIHIKEENNRVERERFAEQKRIADEQARLEKLRRDEQKKIESEKRAKKIKKIVSIATPVFIVAIVFVIILNTVIIPNGKYNAAVALMNDSKYEEAISAFEELNGYKDSAKMIIDIFDTLRQNASIIAGGNHTVILKSDGMVMAVGHNDDGQCNVSNWENIIAVAAGQYHTVGLNADGRVLAVGDNEYKQCDVSSWTDVIAIAAADNHTIGLKSDGTVVAVGNNYFGQCDVDDWTNIVAIATGDSITIGLKSNGTVVAVGSNTYGQCDVSDWCDINMVATAGSHTVGLKLDGTVVAIGWDVHNQCDVSSWTNIVKIAVGYRHTIGLKSNGTVVAIGYDKYDQCNVSEWENIVDIAAGNFHSVGIKADGTTVAVGSNSYGQCGVENWNNIFIP